MRRTCVSKCPTNLFLFENLSGRIIPCMCLANERWRYSVTPSLIGWAHTQKDPRIYILFSRKSQSALGMKNNNAMIWKREREREIKFIGLFENRGHRGPYSPYKPFNHNLYIGIIIFPHIDNPQYTGYDLPKKKPNKIINEKKWGPH